MYPDALTYGKHECTLSLEAIQTHVLQVEVVDKFFIEDRKTAQCFNVLYIDPIWYEITQNCKEDKKYYIYNNAVEVKNFQKLSGQPFVLRLKCKSITSKRLSLYVWILLDT